MSGKTITTYLLDGHPNGPKTVFISNKICKAIVVPRARLAELGKRQELNQPALYFLFNEEKEELYIGETENFTSRSKSHIANKNFWDKTVVFVSKDNDLTKSDIKYLEYLAIKEAKGTNRFDLNENKVIPNPTNLPEHQKSGAEEFFSDIKTLTSFLGYPVFDASVKSGHTIFHCTNRKAKAQGYHHENGFTVLKGSVLPVESTPSYADNQPAREKKLRHNGVLVEKKFIRLESDLIFKTPSAASSFCTGNSSNGWIAWINQSGQTLDDIYRKSITSP